MKGVILGQAGGSGLYGSLELLADLTFSLATLDKEYANCRALSFIVNIYLYHLFVWECKSDSKLRCVIKINLLYLKRCPHK